MAIKLNNVSYSYLPSTPMEVRALTAIDLELEDGLIYGLIGHTGSGKSTLVQLINALLTPTSGTVEVSGRGQKFVIGQGKVKEIRKLRKQAGVVFQFPEYQLFEETVIKDVAFGPRNFGVKPEEALAFAAQCLQQVGIDADYYDKSPFELSGGQKRRVAIAGILALDPDILILDEPTAGLDPQGARSMIELFSSLNKQGKTLIIISHEMNQMLELADRLIVLEQGRLVAQGETSSILRGGGLQVRPPLVYQMVDKLNSHGYQIETGGISDVASLARAIAGSGK